MDLRRQMKEDDARVQVVIAMAAAACGARAEHVAGNERRDMRTVFARQVAMYLASVAFDMSLGRVSRAFGRDRSTVRYACQVMEDRRENAGFDQWMETLETSAAGIPVSA